MLGCLVKPSAGPPAHVYVDRFLAVPFCIHRPSTILDSARECADLDDRPCPAPRLRLRQAPVLRRLRRLSNCDTLGVELKRNVEDTWWRAIIQERDDVVGLGWLDIAEVGRPSATSSFRRPWWSCGTAASTSAPSKESVGQPLPACGGELTLQQDQHDARRSSGGSRQTACSSYNLSDGAELQERWVTRRKLPRDHQIGKAFRRTRITSRFVFRSRRVRADGAGSSPA